MADIPAPVGIRTLPAPGTTRLPHLPELSCQKIVFDLQLADLQVENINCCSLIIPTPPVAFEGARNHAADCFFRFSLWFRSIPNSLVSSAIASHRHRKGLRFTSHVIGVWQGKAEE
jgi:hypothetical protein